MGLAKKCWFRPSHGITGDSEQSNSTLPRGKATKHHRTLFTRHACVCRVVNKFPIWVLKQISYMGTHTNFQSGRRTVEWFASQHMHVGCFPFPLQLHSMKTKCRRWSHGLRSAWEVAFKKEIARKLTYCSLTWTPSMQYSRERIWLAVAAGRQDKSARTDS